MKTKHKACSFCHQIFRPCLFRGWQKTIKFICKTCKPDLFFLTQFGPMPHIFYSANETLKMHKKTKHKLYDDSSSIITVDKVWQELIDFLHQECKWPKKGGRCMIALKMTATSPCLAICTLLNFISTEGITTFLTKVLKCITFLHCSAFHCNILEKSKPQNESIS